MEIEVGDLIFRLSCSSPTTHLAVRETGTDRYQEHIEVPIQDLRYAVEALAKSAKYIEERNNGND